MKRTIMVEILLLFTFVVVLTLGIWCLKAGIMNFNALHNYQEQELAKYAYMYLIFGICGILAALATLTVMVIIALKDFPVFKPMLDKLTAKRADRKQAKAEKAAADKQARIERLQSELDALKKDE